MEKHIQLNVDKVQQFCGLAEQLNWVSSQIWLDMA